MLNINVMDERGFSFQIDLVRFFRANESNYLMYTLNEVDENGYVKLYAAKMIDEGSFARIEEENEWTLVKDLIKSIVREAKEGTVLVVQDLNEKRLEGIRVLSTRAFKLNNEVKEALGMNRPVFEEEMPVLEETKEEPAFEPEMPTLEEPMVETAEPALEEMDEDSLLEVTKVHRFKFSDTEEENQEEAKEEEPNYLEEPKEEELEKEMTMVMNQIESEPELEEASLEGFKALFGDNTFSFDLPKEPEVTEPQQVSSLDELLGTPTYSYENEEPMVETTEEVAEPAEVKVEENAKQLELEARLEELASKVKNYEEVISKLKDILN